MIVKGIIKSIDYTGNTCTVRIPVFESAANENEVVVPATLSTLPGIYNGYKEEDVVFIAFENNDYDMPIVIGKLYLGVENEKNDPRGAIVCNNITAAQPISIPISSQLTLDNDPQHSPIIGVDKGIDSYKSIADLAKNLQKQDEKIGSLSVKVIDDGEQLGARVSKVEKDNVEQASELALHSDKIEARVTKYSKDSPKECEGFGWSMDEKGIVFESALGIKDKNDKYVENKTEVLKIDADGATVTGKLTVKDKEEPTPNIIFEADPFGRPASKEGPAIDPHVLIGGFDVKNNTLTATDNISANSVQLMPDKILMQATKSAYWLKNTRTIEEAHSTYSYEYLFRYLETAANSGFWKDISKNSYDYRIYSKESPENNAVIVPYVEIYNKNDQYAATIFTFYYSYLNSVTPYEKDTTDDEGNVITENFEIWIEVLPENSTNGPRRLLVPYGTTVINDGTYEYPISTFITTYSADWTKLDNNSTYSNYIYDNYTTYYDNYKSDKPFNGVEYSYLQLKITKDIPTTFNIYLGISSNFNIAQNFDTVIALEPTNIDIGEQNSPKFEFDKENGYTFKDTADFILKASTSGNYVSGNLGDLVKVTYPSIVASEEKPKYIYIIYVNRNNTNDEKIEIIGSAAETETTVIDTAGFCVIPNLMTYSDSKLSIGSNFNVTPSGQLTAKNAIFEDNITLIGGGKLGAFELNNNKLSNSAMILDSTGVSLKDYKYLSIGNNKQFRLFKSQIDKSYVDIGGSSTNTKNMVDVSYMQSYHPIIIQKLTPSTNSAKSQSTASTLQGASILLTANDNIVTQYFRIKPTISSITPITSNPGLTLVKPKKAINDQIHTIYTTANSATIGTRYVIDFKVEVFEKVKDENGNETEESKVAKKDYNFTFDAVFSSSMSIMSSIMKPCSIRVPKGRSSASTRYSWTIQGALYNFKGIKNTGGSTTKENLILTETFIDTATDTSAIQLKSASIYLKGTTYLKGDTHLNGTTYLNGTKLESSDRNLKENIKYLDSHADYLNVFNYLKPVEFNYKNNNLTQFGFIAQDILEALPLLDKTKKYSLVVKDNDYYAVDYNSIIALNTLQIKYLTNKLSQLETAYNELLKKAEDK